MSIQTWEPVGIIPQELSDGAVEALACIYVGRIAGMDPNDVVLGDYEHGVVLVAQAEVACAQAAGQWVKLTFSGPPLHVEVDAQELVQPKPFDQDA